MAQVKTAQIRNGPVQNGPTFLVKTAQLFFLSEMGLICEFQEFIFQRRNTPSPPPPLLKLFHIPVPLPNILYSQNTWPYKLLLYWYETLDFTYKIIIWNTLFIRTYICILYSRLLLIEYSKCKRKLFN